MDTRGHDELDVLEVEDDVELGRCLGVDPGEDPTEKFGGRAEVECVEGNLDPNRLPLHLVNVPEKKTTRLTPRGIARFEAG